MNPLKSQVDLLTTRSTKREPYKREKIFNLQNEYTRRTDLSAATYLFHNQQRMFSVIPSL